MSRSWRIDKRWDGRPLLAKEHAHVRVSAVPGGLHLEVEAPFYGDPAPDSDPGPTWALWDHEVVEWFVVGSGDPRPYLEVELGPHGHHLVLRLRGIRKPIQRMLALNYRAAIEHKRWRGEAIIPAHYLPPGPHVANAFAIHGQGAERVYSACTSVPGAAPDFHRLEYFEPVVLPGR